mgnify:CR=1 FL=1|tara:strand:+ start:2560 stop:3879 length:1320 start_codon:yes stop_codon:yes gene_type:complete
MSNYINRENDVTGKDYIIDSPGRITDYLQFIPATVTGVINSEEALLSQPSNAYESNLITVRMSIWTEDAGTMGDDLRKARPLIRGFSDSITIDESVLVTEIGGQLYYLGPLNIKNNPSYNWDDTQKKDTLPSDSSTKTTSVSFPTGTKFTRLNKNFKVDLDDPSGKITPFQHAASGNDVFTDLFTDLTLEGRHGNSINIGSRNINPHIFISNGRNPSQIEESINDSSILAMIKSGTINQHFNREKLDDSPYEFKLADEEIESPEQTIRNSYLSALGRGQGIDGTDDEDVDSTIYEYALPQTILNSDRVIINSRRDNIYISSFKHIHLGSGNTMTFSTSNNVLFNVKDTFVVNSPEIKLGSQNDDETQPIPLGDTLVEKLEELCDHLTQLCTDISSMTHPTPAGPSGPPVNAASFSSLSSKIGSTKGALEDILSIQNRTK